MSHTELHELSSARSHEPAVPSGNLAATIAEVALAVLVVSVWLLTCTTG